ncbi:MAG: hypothetical protein ACL7BU_14555 [Candidatus Phlomobacter fragariae]
MHEVAIKIADKRRKELANIVGLSNAHFIYINMVLPLSAARYQEMVNSAKEEYQTSIKENKAKSIFDNVRRQISNFESGAILFNHTLRGITECNSYNVCGYGIITEIKIDVKLVLKVTFIRRGANM